SRQGADLRKNPRIADGPASYGDAIHACPADHLQAIVRREQVATPQNRSPTSDMPLYLGQKLPAAWPNIPLHHGPTVNRDGGDARVKCTVENREEAFAALRRIIDSSSHLHRQ